MKRLLAMVLLCLFALSVTSPLVFGGAADGPAVELRNGDANGDGVRELSDAIYLLQWLFGGGEEPVAIVCPADQGDRVAELEDQVAAFQAENAAQAAQLEAANNAITALEDQVAACRNLAEAAEAACQLERKIAYVAGFDAGMTNCPADRVAELEAQLAESLADNVAQAAQIENLQGRSCVGVDLEETILVNAENPECAGVQGGRACLIGADLERACLIGADLVSARLTRANLRSADLTDANLQQADLHGAILVGADLTGATLNRSLFSSGGVDDIPPADLRGANLTGADLRSAHLMGTDLRGANLTLANLRSAFLYDTKLTGADLTLADLTYAILIGANLRSADLGGADLWGADLTDANLQQADLHGASLGGARLNNASLVGAILEGADLDGTDLRGATGVNLEGTIGTPRWMPNDE